MPSKVRVPTRRMSWRGAVQTPPSAAFGHVVGFKNGAKLSTGVSRNIKVPVKSLAENVVAAGDVADLVMAAVVCCGLAKPPSASANADATSKPTLNFLILFMI